MVWGGCPMTLGNNMKRRRIIVISIVVLLTGYATWIIWPHIRPIDIEDQAGLSEEDHTEIISHLHSVVAFSGRGNAWVMLASAFNPRSRPQYFAIISGNSEEIEVQSGFLRGPLWGGGPVIRARKIDGVWVFDESSNMRWISKKNNEPNKSLHPTANRPRLQLCFTVYKHFRLLFCFTGGG